MQRHVCDEITFKAAGERLRRSILIKIGQESPERREIMEDIVEIGSKHEKSMMVVTDPQGNHWLCDEEIDPRKDLKEQGCWQCGDEHFAFTRDD